MGRLGAVRIHSLGLTSGYADVGKLHGNNSALRVGIAVFVIYMSRN